MRTISKHVTITLETTKNKIKLLVVVWRIHNQPFFFNNYYFYIDFKYCYF